MVTTVRQFDTPHAQRGAYAAASFSKKSEEFKQLDDIPKVPELHFPSELLLGYLRDGRLRLRSPILVKVIRENDDVVAEAAEFNEFGFGKNLSEALRDLQQAIAELYFTLKENQVCLGHDLQGTWNKLQQIIHERQ